jgi:hypothetical protein
MRALPLALFLLGARTAAPASAAQLPRSGRELYEIGCAKCHGSDGRGVDPSLVGFDTPLPDFTDCRFASREAAADWVAVTHQGGGVRGFSSTMPAYGEAFDVERIEMVVEFARGFCTDRSWPAGELNLPLPLLTEKAFPEDEVLWTTAVDVEGSGAFETELVYERRVGARHQWELAVPAGFTRSDEESSWTGGLGDPGVGWKSALYHDPSRIFTVGGEVFFPTGNSSSGLSSKTTLFEPYVAFAQILPREWFLQLQGGVEVPADSEKAESEAFFRAVVGFSASAAGGFGRTWSPMLEILASTELDGGESNWTALPQMQVTLSTRQHVRANVGLALPLTNTDERPLRVVFYALWDWFDGGLLSGW